MSEQTQMDDIAALRKKIKNLKRKRTRRNHKPATTDKGAFLIARDFNLVFSRRRYDEQSNAVTEIKRLANQENDRFLLLKVVGVIDKRPKK